MKKLFVLFFMALIGISLFSFSANADESRTIKNKYGFAYHANTLIVGHSGTLFRISGVASSANAVWTIYDRSSIADATGAATNSQANILSEGGEATQYDAIVPIDFGEEGLPFNTGLVVVTTTADLTVMYQ